MIFATAVAILLAAPASSGPAASSAVFDPPFAFPAFKKLAPGTVPAKEEFDSACFSYIYGLVRSEEKPGNKKINPVNLPEVMMASCHQKDKEGCRRFSEQLEGIIEQKQGEPRMSIKPHKHGHATSKQAKSSESKAPATKKADVPVAVAKPALRSSAATQKVPPTSEASHPATPKKWSDYGMKVWQPKKKAKMALLKEKPAVESRSFRAQDYGMTPWDGSHHNKKKLGLLHHNSTKKTLALLDVGMGPKSYQDWCAKLYAAATSSWEPKATTTTTTATTTTSTTSTTKTTTTVATTTTTTKAAKTNQTVIAAPAAKANATAANRSA